MGQEDSPKAGLCTHEARQRPGSNSSCWLNDHGLDVAGEGIGELQRWALTDTVRRLNIFLVIIEIISIHFLHGWTETCFQ